MKSHDIINLAYMPMSEMREILRDQEVKFHQMWDWACPMIQLTAGIASGETKFFWIVTRSSQELGTVKDFGRVRYYLTDDSPVRLFQIDVLSKTGEYVKELDVTQARKILTGLIVQKKFGRGSRALRKYEALTGRRYYHLGDAVAEYNSVRIPRVPNPALYSVASIYAMSLPYREATAHAGLAGQIAGIAVRPNSWEVTFYRLNQGNLVPESARTGYYSSEANLRQFPCGDFVGHLERNKFIHEHNPIVIPLGVTRQREGVGGELPVAPVVGGRTLLIV